MGGCRITTMWDTHLQRFEVAFNPAQVCNVGSTDTSDQ